MDQLADRLIEFVPAQDHPIGFAILALAAGLEYVFPPFPGDTITLFGAFLITARQWSFAGVFLATLAGSAAGAMADFALGVWIAKRGDKKEQTSATREKLNRLLGKFKQHGELYIVINRFLPGIRALFFVAAGMARMRPWRVLLWAVVSAALWNLMLIAIGSALGANFEALSSFFGTYSWFAWGAVLAVVLAWLVRRWWRAD